MALNLNSSPYYDDFDGNKNYSRILFKPGVAVQARELTQLQTLLSDQLSQLSSFTLKDGAIISGCEERVSSIRYIKIKDTDLGGTVINNIDLSNYIGAEVIGSTTGLKAQILAVRQGAEETPATANVKTLYLNYNDRAGTARKVFAIGETLTVVSLNNTISGHTFVTYDSGSEPTGSRLRYEGSAPKIELSPGIIYARGSFIRTTSLAAFIDPFVIASDKNIGFYISEAVVGSSNTGYSDLLDPARGSFNHNAPGADRLQLVASLRSYDYQTAALPENFYQYATWRNGGMIRSKIKTNPLAGVGDAIAKSAFNANGSYTITGLQTVIHEHLALDGNGGHFSAAQGGSADKFVFAITPGKANVGGYPIENKNKDWKITIDKPTDTKIETSIAQSTAYGNYTLINENSGVWDVDGGETVSLYDTARTSVTSGTFSSTSIAAGNQIGSAKVRYISLASGDAGTAAAQYRLYMYDIKMSRGTFKEVKSISYTNGTANAVADTVLVSGEAVIQEGNYNRLVWELPYASLKTLKANSSAYNFDFKFIDEFDVEVNGSTGVVALSPSDPSSQSFFFATGTLSDSVITSNIHLVAVDSFTIGSKTYAAGEYVDLTDSSVTVTCSGTSSVSITFSSPPTGGNADLKAYVNMQQNSIKNPISKTYTKDKIVKIDTQATGAQSLASNLYCLGVSDLIKIKSITATDNADYVTNRVNVTNEFIVDNGQRDSYYGLAKLKQKATSAYDLATKRYILVTLDYMISADGSTGPTFACVDSYSAAIAGGDMTLQEIPLYYPSSGRIIDLRNCIDFRPYVIDTAELIDKAAFDAADAAGKTVLLNAVAANPSTNEVINRPTNGLTNPVPSATFNTNLEYYLAQAFKVVVTAEGEFKVLTSDSAEFPKIPPVPDNALTLSEGIFAPYPCLSPKAANYYKRADLKAYIEQVRTKRYTMKDIGGLEKRIANLEYYTALSLLEKESKSLEILDASGVDRFKNGLMIDAFNTYGVMAVGHDDNKCSLDLKRQQLRASFDSSIIAFKPIATDTTVGQTGDMFHVPYVEAVYTKQLQASKTKNLISELLFADPEPLPVVPDPIPDPAPPPIIPPPPVTPVVPPVPPKANEVYYNLIRSSDKINEGQSVTISLEVLNLPNPLGTTVGYSVSGVDSADISGASLTGSFTLDASGDASVTFNTVADADTVDETLTLTLTGLAGTTKGTLSTSVTISDTTVIIPPPPPILGPFAGSMTLSPSQDSWFDDAYAEPAYQNKEGSWDNLEIKGDWKETWGAWDLVSEDIVNATSTITEGEIGIPPKGFGGGLSPSSVDIVTKEEANGYWETEVKTWTGRRQLYDITTTIAGKNTQTWERTGSRIFYGTIPDEVTESTGDSVINTEVAAWVRPISISGTVDGLMPNAVHAITMGGISKGSVTSNSNGRATFSISVNQGEFKCGNITVEVTDSNVASGIDSYASAIFSANGTKRTLQTTYVTTRWPEPPVGAIPLQETKTEILPVGEDGRTMTKKGDVIITTVQEEGVSNWIPVDDVFVTSSCALGVGDGTVGNSISTYQRYDGTTYNVEAPSAACTPVSNPEITLVATDTITCALTPTTDTKKVVEEVDTTTGAVTLLQAVDDVIITEVSIFDTATNTNSGGDASGVTTVTLSNGAILVADGLDESDFVAGVTTTEGRYAVATENLIRSGGATVDLITTPFSSTINDATVSANTNTIVATAAAAFDHAPIFKIPTFQQISDSICIFDPLAQTFYVTGMPGGMFVPSIDVFFKTISSEANNNGVTLEIREVVNGNPTAKVVPNGRVFLRRSDVDASGINADGSVDFRSTKFRFNHLVHLNNDTEYCIVLRPEANDPGYEAWVAELGELQINSTNRITKQAHGGVLFTSANDRSWSAHQSEDLMFMVNRCKFKTNTDYVLNTANKNIDWIKVDNNTWDDTVVDGKVKAPKFDLNSFVHGFKLTLATAGEYATDGTYALTFTGGGGSNAAGTYVVAGGIVTTVTLTNPGNGYTSAPTITLPLGSPTSAATQATVSVELNRGQVTYFDSYYKTWEILVTDGKFTASDLISDGINFVNIDSINDRVVDAYVLKSSVINPNEKGVITKSIALTKTAAASANTTHTSLQTNATVELEEEKTIYSYSNEQRNYAGNKTSLVKFTLNTPLNNLSPIVDLAGMSMGMYKNKINNPSPVTESVRFGGNASAKYISRQVVLADKQDAEDMRVFLDNKIPAGADVEVYGKFRNAEDDAEFVNDIFWHKLEIETSPKVRNENFAQYVYKIPAKGSNSYGTDSSTGVYEYDVRRISNIAVSAGGTGYTQGGEPIVTLTHSAGTGYGATAVAVVNGAGEVSEIKITNPGRGYDTGTVSATLTGGDGTGATAGTVTISTITFKGYKDFAIKIVHLSDNTAKIPKSSGLRAYALQV